MLSFLEIRSWKLDSDVFDVSSLTSSRLLDERANRSKIMKDMFEIWKSIQIHCKKKSFQDRSIVLFTYSVSNCVNFRSSPSFAVNTVVDPVDKQSIFSGFSNGDTVAANSEEEERE